VCHRWSGTNATLRAHRASRLEDGCLLRLAQRAPGPAMPPRARRRRRRRMMSS